METIEIGWLSLYVLLCITALVCIILYSGKKAQRPQRKSTTNYVHISSEENLSFSKDFYDLEWKPAREVPEEIHPEISKYMEEMDSLSPLVTNLSVRLNEPDINPKEISRLIVSDQVLTTFILKRVNSPYYGLVQRIDNIFNAIIILGYNEIHRIVMEERLRKVGIKPSKNEWIHANLTSNIAAYLTSSSRIGASGGTMVTLGMLHDIAKNIMQNIKPDIEWPADPRQRLKLETETFGIDHAMLGGELAKVWKMPEKLCTGISAHHYPMFWPLRDTAQVYPRMVKELALLSISDVCAKNYLGQMENNYVGDDYFIFIKKSPRIETLLTAEIKRDLDRIAKFGEEENRTTSNSTV